MYDKNIVQTINSQYLKLKKILQHFILNYLIDVLKQPQTKLS
jgi:hypothetical protein